jgi:hypothetical protein
VAGTSVFCCFEKSLRVIFRTEVSQVIISPNFSQVVVCGWTNQEEREEEEEEEEEDSSGHWSSPQIDSHTLQIRDLCHE